MGWTFWRLPLAAAAVVVATGGGPALAVSVGVDDRRVSPGATLVDGTHFDDFRAEVRAVGELVPVGSFTPAELAPLDAIVLQQDTGPLDIFSPAQLSAIHDFVASGGGLILFAEGGTGSELTLANFNELAAPYGGQFSALLRGENGQTLGGFRAHPLTRGVTTIGMDYYRPLSRVSPPAIDLTTGTDDVLAVREGAGGAGNVVLFADSSAFTDAGTGADRTIGFANNRQLLRNMLTYAVPEPGGATACLPLAAALLARRRRRSGRSRLM